MNNSFLVLDFIVTHVDDGRCVVYFLNQNSVFRL
jgi:hypothetical protein